MTVKYCHLGNTKVTKFVNRAKLKRGAIPVSEQQPNDLFKQDCANKTARMTFSVSAGSPLNVKNSYVPAERSQQVSWSRVIFNPVRFPRTVTAIWSGAKNSCAHLCTSSIVTASTFSMISFIPVKRS